MIAVLTAAAALASPQVVRLSNGLPVIVSPEPGTGLVAIQALVRTDDLTPEELAGAELIASSLFGETQSFTPQRLRTLTWFVGSHVGATMVGDNLRIEISTEASHFNPAVSLLSELLQRAAFTAKSLQAGLRAHEQGDRELSQDPWFKPLRHFFAELGAGPAALPQLSPEVAASLYRRLFRPERTVIAVVGDVRHEEVGERLGKSVGLWKPEQAPMPRLRNEKRESPASDGFRASMVAFRGPRPGDAGFAAWLTLVTLLGHGKGSLMNRVFRVQKGWTYLSGVSVTFRHDGAWAVAHIAYRRAGVSEAEAKGRTKELRELVASIAAGVSEANFERARGFLAGRYAVAPGRPDGRVSAFAQGHLRAADRAFWLAWWEMKGAGFRADEEFPAQVHSVSVAQVRASAAKWLSDLREMTCL